MTLCIGIKNGDTIELASDRLLTNSHGDPFSKFFIHEGTFVVGSGNADFAQYFLSAVQEHSPKFKDVIDVVDFGMMFYKSLSIPLSTASEYGSFLIAQQGRLFRLCSVCEIADVNTRFAIGSAARVGLTCLDMGQTIPQTMLYASKVSGDVGNGFDHITIQPDGSYTHTTFNSVERHEWIQTTNVQAV